MPGLATSVRASRDDDNFDDDDDDEDDADSDDNPPTCNLNRTSPAIPMKMTRLWAGYTGRSEEIQFLNMF